MIYALSIVVGPTIGGLIYQDMGGNTVWYLSGLIGLVCLLICNYFKKAYSRLVLILTQPLTNGASAANFAFRAL